jgi:hypothetical protein
MAWVAPSIAADIWGTSVEQIMSGVADGTIPSRIEGQFLFVNIAGGGLRQESPSLEQPTEAVEVLSDAERLALEEIHKDESDAQEMNLSQWRLSRFQSSLRRTPPVAVAA